MTNLLERIEILLLIAAFVAMLARKLRLPYTIGLVAAGLLLGLLHVETGLTLTQELIFAAFLPPLVFEAAFFIRWSELKQVLRPVLLLATLGVAVAAGSMAVGMRYLAGWPWQAALVFGALIAATDPVSVIATFKEAGVTGRLRLLVESESLLNDGAAAVLFGVVLTWATGSEVTAGGVGLSILREVGGGIVIGLVVGWVLLWIAGRTEQHLVEITFTTVAAYGSFFVAQHFHASGVLSALVCGLVMGNIGVHGAISAHGHEAVEAFWEYAAFVVNSLIFLLIGTRTAEVPLLSVVGPILLAFVLSVAGRAAGVYPLAALLSRGTHRIDARHQHVLVWGGLRGALALALALGLPATLPHHAEVQVVAFGVVALSIVAQGLTMEPLLRRLGQLPAEKPPRVASGP